MTYRKSFFIFTLRSFSEVGFIFRSFSEGGLLSETHAMGLGKIESPPVSISLSISF